MTKLAVMNESGIFIFRNHATNEGGMFYSCFIFNKIGNQCMSYKFT
jgi:hypothetical protein